MEALTVRRDVDSDQVRSLSRAISLLRILGGAKGASIRLTDIAGASGLHKATAHRILATLAKEGFVQQDGREGYALGPELYLLGAVAAKRFDISLVSLPILDRIAEATGDVALLFVPSGPNGVCVRRHEGTAPIIPGTTRVGTVKPLGVGAGCLALLMAMDDAEEIIARNEKVRLAAYPHSTGEYLRHHLGLARRQGFSLDDQSITPGVRAIGVPVLDGRGRLLASISCTVFADRLPPARQPEIAALLRDAAADMTRLLGPAGGSR